MFFFNALFSHAYIVGRIVKAPVAPANNEFEAQKVNQKLPSKKTHIIATGPGHEAAMLFQESAITKAYKYIEMYPQNQVILIIDVELYLEPNLLWLRNRGVEILKYNVDDLYASDFLYESLKYPFIDSIDFFSHTAASYGIQLSETEAGKLNGKTEDIVKLKSHLTPEAIINVNGCNSGFFMSPFLSKILEVPVTGSLTSTDFQVLFEDGQFYFNNKESFPSVPKSKLFNLSEEKVLNCRLGLCTRMKPINGAYTGYWGDYYAGGLPFYKMFCGPKVSEERCQKGMAKVIKTFVSFKNLNEQNTFEDYKLVVQDFLCPIGVNPLKRNNCIESLEKSLTDPSLNTYSPFAGPSLQCSFLKCEFAFKFKGQFYDQPNGKLENLAKGPVTTLADEYRIYLQAFKYL
jgi:hypothetical protein